MLFRFILFLISAWLVALVLNRLLRGSAARRSAGPDSLQGGGNARREQAFPEDQIVEARFTEVPDPSGKSPAPPPLPPDSPPKP